MDPKINKRKKNINTSKSSSEEIYATLDEVESDLEEDIDQLQVYVPQNIRKIYFLHKISKTRF